MVLLYYIPLILQRDKSSIQCSIEGHRSLRTAGDAELALGEGGTRGDLSSKTMWISWVLPQAKLTVRCGKPMISL